MYVRQIIKDFLKENKYTFTLYFLTYIILYSLEFIGISVVLGKLVTILKQNKLKNFKFSLDLLSSFKYGYIYNIVLILCLLYLLNFSLIHLVNNIYNKLYSKLFSFIRIKLTKNLINNKKVNFKNLEVCKDLISLDLTSHYISTFIDNLLTEIIPLIIFTFVVLVFLFIIGFEYGLLFFIAVCSVFFYILYQKDKIIKTAKDKESVYLDMVNNSENSFSNLANILINNTSEYEIGKNSKLTNKFKNGIIKLYDIINKTVYNIRCMLAFFIFILLMLIFTNFKQNKIKLSMTIIFIFVLTNYIMFFRNKIYKIIVNFKYVGQIDINKEQFDILLENKNKNNNNKKKLSIKSGCIEFKNVKFGFLKNKLSKNVFNNFNLIIEDKQKLAIIGKSGSGKTTLIKLLLRFYQLNSGEIKVDNKNISDYDLDYLRKNIYYVNQNTNLFNKDVYYNLTYGLNVHNNNINDNNEKMNEKVKEFLKRNNLLDIFDKLPKKLDTVCGPNGTNLSLGMQKIVFLVRGLLNIKEKKSKIIVFDEPLTALDKNTREKVIKMIIKETKLKTLIIITHDSEIIPYVDRTIDLKNHTN